MPEKNVAAFVIPNRENIIEKKKNNNKDLLSEWRCWVLYYDS